MVVVVAVWPEVQVVWDSRRRQSGLGRYNNRANPHRPGATLLTYGRVTPACRQVLRVLRAVANAMAHSTAQHSPNSLTSHSPQPSPTSLTCHSPQPSPTSLTCHSPQPSPASVVCPLKPQLPAALHSTHLRHSMRAYSEEITAWYSGVDT